MTPAILASVFERKLRLNGRMLAPQLRLLAARLRPAKRLVTIDTGRRVVAVVVLSAIGICAASASSAQAFGT